MADSQTVIAAFTELAARYEQTVDRELRQFWGIGYREFVAMLLDHADPGRAGLTLDVATGRGVIPLSLLRERGWSGPVIGLDITRAMLAGAAREVAQAGAARRIHLVCGTGMRLPFANATFETAVCALATHHMNVPALLREMRRVVVPGGQIIVADVALASFWHSNVGGVALRVLTWWYTLREEPTRAAAEKDTPANMLTPDQWRDEISRAGFSVTKSTVMPARRRWYPPGLIVAARASA